MLTADLFLLKNLIESKSSLVSQMSKLTEIMNNFGKKMNLLTSGDVDKVIRLLCYIYSKHKLINKTQITICWNSVLIYSKDSSLLLKMGSCILKKEGPSFFQEEKSHSSQSEISSFFRSLTGIQMGSVPMNFEFFFKFCKNTLKDEPLMKYLFITIRKWRIAILTNVDKLSERDINIALRANSGLSKLCMMLNQKLIMLEKRPCFKEVLPSLNAEFLILESMKDESSEFDRPSVMEINSKYMITMLLKTMNMNLKSDEHRLVFMLRMTLNGLKYCICVKNNDLFTFLTVSYCKLKSYLSSSKISQSSMVELDKLLTFIDSLKFKTKGNSYLRSYMDQLLNFVYLTSLTFFQDGVFFQDLEFLRTQYLDKIEMVVLEAEVKLKMWLFSSLFYYDNKLLDDAEQTLPFLEDLIDAMKYLSNTGCDDFSIYYSLDSLAILIDNSPHNCAYNSFTDQVKLLLIEVRKFPDISLGSQLLFSVTDLCRLQLQNKDSLKQILDDSLKSSQIIHTLKKTLDGLVSSRKLKQSECCLFKEIINENEGTIRAHSFDSYVTILDLFFSSMALGDIFKEDLITYNSIKLIYFYINVYSKQFKEQKQILVIAWIETQMAVFSEKLRIPEHYQWTNSAINSLESLENHQENNRRKSTKDHRFIELSCWLDLLNNCSTIPVHTLDDLDNESPIKFNKKEKLREIASRIDDFMSQNLTSSKSFTLFMKFKLVLCKFENCIVERAKLLKELSQALKSTEWMTLDLRKKLQGDGKNNNPLIKLFPGSTFGANQNKENVIFDLFIKRVTATNNPARHYSIVLDCYSQIEELAYDLRFKLTASKIASRAISFSLKIGNFFDALHYASKKTYSIRMRIPQILLNDEIENVEQDGATQEASWLQNKMEVEEPHSKKQKLEIEAILSLLGISTDFLNTQIGSYTCLKDIYRSISEQVSINFEGRYMVRKEKRYLNEFVLAFTIDLVSTRGYKINSLYYNKRFREFLLKDVDRFSVSSYSDIINERKSNLLLKMLNKSFKNVSDLLFENSFPKKPSLLIQKSNQFDNFFTVLNRLLDGYNRQEQIYSISIFYLQLCNTYVNRSVDFDELYCLYHLQLHKILTTLYYKSCSLSQMHQAREILDLIVSNVYQLTSPMVTSNNLFKDDRINSEQEYPRIKEIFEMSMLSTNVGHNLRILVKEDYIRLVKLKEEEELNNPGIRNMKRQTLRNATSYKEFYKYSYYKLKAAKGEFRFLPSQRYPELIINSLIDKKFVSVFPSDDSLNSGKMNSLNTIVFNKTSKGLISMTLDNDKVISDSILNFCKLQQAIENQLKYSFKDGIRCLNKIQYGKERKLLNKRLENLMKNMERDLKEIKYTFLPCWRDKIRISGYKQDTTIEDVNQLQIKTSELVAETVNDSESILNKAVNDNSVNLILPGALSLLPLEHLEFFSKHGVEFLRVESTLIESHTKANDNEVIEGLNNEEMNTMKGQNKSRYSTYNIFGNKSRISIQNTIQSLLCYYIINPEGNLKKTQDRLSNIFKTNSKWKGVIGTAPDSSEIAQCMKEGYNLMYNLNLTLRYCGHGDGIKYMNIDYLNRLKHLNNQVVLMGCSSASMFRIHDIDRVRDVEHSSLASEYLSSGSSVVFGNLWSVTDLDSDAITKSLVNNLFKEEYEDKETSLEELRKQYYHLPLIISNHWYRLCKLEYLNGAAFVKYGSFEDISSQMNNVLNQFKIRISNNI